MLYSGNITRRAVLSGIAAAAATGPALAQNCRIGPPPHTKGPLVFMNYDQVELDAAYEQARYDPLLERTGARMASNSDAVRKRLGQPQRVAYGPTSEEKLDIYRTGRPKAPIFVFIHGGTWRSGSASNSGYAAEMFVKAGAHYIAIDFIQARAAKGNLAIIAEQVCRAIAWVYRNAASFDGDPNRLFVGGHSSGGHLCAVALVTDWEKMFGISADIIKGGLCMSGLYDMKPVRLSWRRSYVNFTDAMEDATSPQRHVTRLKVPIIVTYGSFETPEFQRQARDVAAAVAGAGKPVELIKALNYAHDEMADTLGNPYGPNGRAALAMMKLTAT
jgi:arylformamidase